MSRTPNARDHRDRLAPPATLTDDERTIWHALVAAVASDHFSPSDAPLLTEYVRAAALADKAATELAAGAVVNGKVSPWIGVQEKTQRSLVALSARLRLCPQSRFDRLKAGTTTRTGLPDLDDDDDLLAKPDRRPRTGLASFR